VIPVAALVVIIVILVIAGLIAAGRTFRVVQQYEKGIVYRFGRVLPEVRGPGLTYLRPIGDRMQKVNMQIVAMAVPAQDGITRDNVSVRVDAVVYFRVVDPIKATVNVQDYMFAIAQQAQTSLRSIIGQSEMDQLLAERESVNRQLRRIIDEPTEGPWGIRVERVEVKDVSLPEGMKRSMSRQAEAERERRARIITADGEYQASKRLAAAANVMARDPAALQLRLLQTMVEVAGERNSTLIMPVPVELLRFFEKMAPGPPQPVARPDEPEDLGDAEVAEAEAEISMANVPELDQAPVPQVGEAAVPPLPEVEPAPDVAPVPAAVPVPQAAPPAGPPTAEVRAAEAPPVHPMPSPAETTQELPAAIDFTADFPGTPVSDTEGASSPDPAAADVTATSAGREIPNGRSGKASGAAGSRKPRATGERKARTPATRTPATRKPRTAGGAQAGGEPAP
jgi:regulator of protease activity HflC (stomatin/prohibitin superfamily)